MQREREREREREPRCLGDRLKNLLVRGSLGLGGEICQVGTKECWGHMEARSTLVCKICTSAICPGSESRPTEREGLFVFKVLLPQGNRLGKRHAGRHCWEADQSRDYYCIFKTLVWIFPEFELPYSAIQMGFSVKKISSSTVAENSVCIVMNV